MQETHRRHMSSMQPMQGMFPDPFMSSMSMFGAQPAIDGGAGMRSRQLQAHRSRDPMGAMGMGMGMPGMAMSPFGGFGMMNSMFGNMNAMMGMGNMQRNMERMANDPNTHTFSSSSVMSYSNTGDGQPQVYHATSSTKQAPGGIRESRKTVRDSRRGVEKMSIGHHIGERSHVIEKSKDSRTGDMEETQDFVNIEETDAERFDREWRQRTGAGGRHAAVGGARSRPTVSAITDGREYMHDRETRPVRHRDEPVQSVHFDRSERTSDDTHPYQRRPTPARPKGPSKGGRQRDHHDD